MAGRQTDETANLAQILQQQNEILEGLRRSQAPRDVNFGDSDYQAKLRAERKEFPRPVYQNGFEANPSGLSDETLTQIGELKPGKYLGGVVEILAGSRNAIDFRYKNATADQRMALMPVFGSFAELVAKCHAEMVRASAA